MKRLKKWLEGGAIALMSWVLVGTLVFAVPMQAKASFEASATFDMWAPHAPSRKEHSFMGWTAYENQSCNGEPMARNDTALELYRSLAGRDFDAIGTGAIGWVCTAGSNGERKLREWAERDFQSCRQWVGAEYDRYHDNHVDWQPEPGSTAWVVPAIKIGVKYGKKAVSYGAAIYAGWKANQILDEEDKRETDIDKICGSSIQG